MEIKKCPFCGGEAEIYENNIIKSLPSYNVFCTNCYSRTYGMYEKLDEAIEAWNRRVDDEREEKN